MATFEEKIADLRADIAVMNALQTDLQKLIDRNTEASEGESMLMAAEVLIREAIGHYEEEIDVYTGHDEVQP